MGLLNPLKKVTGALDKVTGGMAKLKNKIPGVKQVDKLMGKLPAPGHTIIGDAIAKKRTKIFPPPATKRGLPPVTALADIGQGNKFQGNNIWKTKP